MNELIIINKSFQDNLDTLKEYIFFNKEDKEAKFREYRDIIYGAIINRGYTLWESFVKDIFYEYFNLRKKEYYAKNTIIERYRLHELPGFLFEEAFFDIKNERITFNLNKDILSYTSKNMDISELSKLFKRIDIDIQSKLNRDKELDLAVYNFELAFEDGLLDENKTAQALKRIIQERNLVSHYAHLDSFQSIDILIEWINYFSLLGKALTKILCLEYGKTIDKNKQEIGDCKNVIKQNILLVDTNETITIDKSTKIFVYSNGSLIDIVTPESFKVEDKDVSSVKKSSKAGIKVRTIFENETKVKKEYKYCVLEEPIT
jgi:hypothetical protein